MIRPFFIFDYYSHYWHGPIGMWKSRTTCQLLTNNSCKLRKPRSLPLGIHPVIYIMSNYCLLYISLSLNGWVLRSTPLTSPWTPEPLNHLLVIQCKTPHPWWLWCTHSIFKQLETTNALNTTGFHVNWVTCSHSWNRNEFVGYGQHVLSWWGLMPIPQTTA